MTILERLRKLDELATPGPWENGIAEYGDGTYQAVGPEHHPDFEQGTWEELSDKADIDQELINTLRNALPVLLEVVEAAKVMTEAFDGYCRHRESSTTVENTVYELQLILAKLEAPDA